MLTNNFVLENTILPYCLIFISGVVIILFFFFILFLGLH